MLIHSFARHSLLFGVFFFCILLAQGQTKKEPLITLLDHQQKPTEGPGFSYFELRWKEGDLWHAQWYWNPEQKLYCDFYYADSTRQKRHGRYLEFLEDGLLTDSGTYDNGALHGDYFSWHRNGSEAKIFHYNHDMPVDTCIIKNEDGTLDYVSITDSSGNGIAQWFHENGTILKKGRLYQGLRSGLWTVYDSSKQKIMEVNFAKDSVVSSTCFDAVGNPLSGSCVYEKPASFPGGLNGWRQFLEKKLQYPDDAISMNIQGVVKVEFKVSKEGDLSNFKILSSPHELLSREVLRLMKTSPKWEPALQYNQPVNHRHVQSIAFYLN